jgi:hypothetical protein
LNQHFKRIPAYLKTCFYDIKNNFSHLEAETRGKEEMYLNRSKCILHVFPFESLSGLQVLQKTYKSYDMVFMTLTLSTAEAMC